MKNAGMYLVRPTRNGVSWRVLEIYKSESRQIIAGDLYFCNECQRAICVAFADAGAREREILETDFEVSMSETFNGEHRVWNFRAEIDGETKGFQVDSATRIICG